MAQTIAINLTVEELNGVLQTLGQLPTSSNAWPLMMKIKEQAEMQVTPPTPEAEDTDTDD